MKFVRSKWKYRVYVIIGVVLMVLTLVTGTYGLPKEDKEIYYEALKLDEKVKGFGFPDFAISDYKVRFFDGDADYVIKGETIEKEKAVFETFVGTTVEVDGEFQVMLPTYGRFAQMYSALSSVENMAEGSISFDEADYSQKAHIATLWHEAFHTWQFTKSAEELYELAEKAGIGGENSYEEVVQNEVDSNHDQVLLLEKEIQLLFQAYQSEDMTAKRLLLEQVFELQEERAGLLSEQAVVAEQYYKTVEGSARYIESCVYKELEGEEAWENIYMSPFVYENGSGKYYTEGMIKCMILDQIVPDWKKNFDVTVSLDVLLHQGLEEMQK